MRLLITMILTGATVSFGATTSWNANVVAGAAWNNAANWSAGIPTTNDTANFANTQSTTYAVDIAVPAMANNLTLSQSYTFGGAGSLALRGNSSSAISFVLNQSAVTNVFNVPVSVSQGGTGYSQISTVAGGKLIFNNTFESTGASSTVNLIRNVEFNGNINLANRFRMNTGVGNDQTVTIGGTGTTTSTTNWVLTGGVSLHLNRAGAYTTDDRYMYVELADIYFGAAQATAAGTDIRLKQAGYGLIDKGFDQNFGWLDVDAAAVMNMSGSRSVWTFDDSTGNGWAATLSITNASRATIRFAMDPTGLTTDQIGKIQLDGQLLTPADTRVDGGYLYITPNRARISLVVVH